MPLPLSGLLVVSLEQAVAAPMCTCRLADAGARVIKVERPEGDFARYYDKLALPRAPTSPRLRGEVATRSVAGEGDSPSRRVLGDSPSPLPSPRKRGEGVHRASGEEEQGESAYFVWLNRGKESLVLDLARADDKALLAAMLAKADVFVQNLKPGAVAKLGFALEELRRAHPRLVICSISGYGEDGPYAARKAYDMLVQAESGLASVTGGPEAPARVGVSVCDVAAGMNAYEAILAALLARERSGDGAAISISMFDAMAEWMAVPLIQYEGGAPPKRIGLAHTSIAPYGAFKTKDGADILISIQSDREWRVLAEKVLDDKVLAADPAFATNVERVKRRAETDARVAAVFGATDEAALT
jgi:itaconate CoA-transferase